MTEQEDARQKRRAHSVLFGVGIAAFVGAYQFGSRQT